MLQHEIKSWEKGVCPANFWIDKNNHFEYIVWLGDKLRYKDIDDWYKVKGKDFHDNHGGSLLANYYNDSPYQIISELFPENNWKPWLFVSSLKNFWTHIENRKQYMGWLKECLGYTNIDDWYKIRSEDFNNHHGTTLLYKYYHGNVYQLLSNIFSDYNWKPWKFAQVEKHFWENSKNRQEYFHWLGEILGYKRYDDWYNIKCSDFINNYGNTLFQKYRGSIVLTVMDNFPQYDWKEWLFARVPPQFWNSKENCLRYLDWLGDKLGFTEPEQWYQITNEDFKNNRGSGFLAKYKSTWNGIISNIEYDWEVEKFYRDKKMQKRLYRFVKERFPDAIFDYWHPDMRFAKSGYKMQIDVWIPSIQVGIEYQDPSHFKLMPYDNDVSFQARLERDMEKRKKAKKIGINLLEITYKEWNGDKKYIDKLINEKIKHIVL